MYYGSIRINRWPRLPPSNTTGIKPNYFTCLVTQLVESLIWASVFELRHHCEVSQPAVSTSVDFLSHLHMERKYLVWRSF